MKRFGIIAALTLSALFSAQWVLAESAVNPLFTAWEKYGVGSSETLEGTVDSAAGKMTTSTVSKLLEKTDDHVVIETSTSVTFNGVPRTAPPKKTTIEKDAAEAKEMKQLGTEDVSAAGKTFHCKIFTAASPTPSAQVTSKIWASADVPGGVVKLEISGKLTVVQTLKSFEAK